VIPSRRLATAAGDQGVPAYLEALREWEVQSVASPPRPAFPVVQDVALPALLEVEVVRDVAGDGSKESPPGDDEEQP